MQGSNGNEPGVTRPAEQLGRRQFMYRAAVVGTLVWTIPTIVSIEPAAAAGAVDRHSTPPRPPVEPIGGVTALPRLAAPTQVAVTKRRGSAQLPFTGDNESLGAAIGLAAIAAGSALIALGSDAERGHAH